MFAKYHYLNHSHNNAADVFVCTINNDIAGFFSVLPFPHPKLKNARKAHRIVVKPDYQGIGISKHFSEFICNYYKKLGKVLLLVTSHPALIYSLSKNKKWICTRKGRTAKNGKSSAMKNTSSSNRITCSFKYKG